MTNLAGCPSIVILTGAGISAESGVATFRDKDGLWSKVRIEDVATPEAFLRDPAGVHAFYNARRRGLGAIQPNAAHQALARLERDFDGDFLLVTQNIDHLHEAAGSRAVLHMHGELQKALCVLCDRRSDWIDDLSVESCCPHCNTAGGMRPDVVWFGEMPYRMEEIYERLADCALFVSIGTSGTVYPAAGFADEARHCGALTVEINLEPTGAALFHETRAGPATSLVPAFVDEILSGSDRPFKKA
ncbi:NAD-dependent deacylase [Pararhizobium haloflavum]|uniref:NAD-dependent deacylase n=1 Tax=Pararhizobium haloflavum TaxID=2037914 RepID=UPI000C1A2C0E|nr:NAD-dependent deacylase [Pararhizobium haloflavum]